MRRFSIYWSLCENGFEKFYLKIFSNYQTYLSNLLRRRSIKSSDWLFGSRESRESNSSQIPISSESMNGYLSSHQMKLAVSVCDAQLSQGKSSQIWSTIYLCTSWICILSSIYQDVLCSLSSIPNEIVLFLVFKAGTCSRYFLYFAVCI